MSSASLTEPAKLLLLVSLLARDGLISGNGKAFLKELILDGDERLTTLLSRFDEHGQSTMFLDVLASLVEEEANKLFDALFETCPLERGKSLSKAERETRELKHEKSLIYGEVEFFSFSRVLRKIAPKAGGTFYDLGSGTARAVMIARVLYDFDRCVGVEILESLHGAAQTIVDRFDAHFKGFLNHTEPQAVEVHQGSILDFDWSDGDIVFANSTCFDDGLMSAMAERARALKPGAYFVTFTKGLNSPMFEVLERKRYKMSWGPATVFIHRRLNHDLTSFSEDQLQPIPDDESYKHYDSPEEQFPVSPGSRGLHMRDGDGGDGEEEEDTEESESEDEGELEDLDEEE